VYVPIDISREMLLASAEQLELRYPGLAVRPVVGDYMHELDLPLAPDELSAGVTAFFPGSTIGNFEHDEAVAFLLRVKRCSPRGANLLIGVDLPKARAVLEAAYDDASGITARFNLNVLRVLNRDYGAHFRLDDFSHRAVWNEAKRRVEMHLVCQRDHVLKIGTRAFEFRAGEPIITEHCYKYSTEDFRELAESAGYRVEKVWLDRDSAFSVQLLVPGGS
jgi:dimethylhistidine N-methyltransferase